MSQIVLCLFRYIDDVFMTTNLSLDEINRLLDSASNKDENISISRSIGPTVEFLDVCIDNNQGQLKTKVFHKPAAEPYIVPYLSDHPRHIHRNTIRGALFRAVRLCSNVEDFDKERLKLELTLLLNGYPPRFISYHLKKFLEENRIMSVIEQLDDHIYQELHDELIRRLTRRERERQNKIRSSSISKQFPFNPIEQQPNIVPRKEFRVYFTFESGPMLDFKRRLRHLWKKYYIYPGSPMNSVTLKINTRTNKSLYQLLVKKKPSKSMLTNVDTANVT